MNGLKLSAAEVHVLRQEIRATKSTKILKRSQTLILLSEGVSITAISTRLGVTRQSIYNWVQSYQEQKGIPISRRLEDSKHSGRPPEKTEAIFLDLQARIKQSPREHGYYNSGWTASLLRKFYRDHKQIEVSDRTIRRCLKQLDKSWKRPRHGLARQSKTWGQGKGGSRED